MSPQDVLIEAIAAASLHGDTPELRQRMSGKLDESLKTEILYALDARCSTNTWNQDAREKESA